MRFDTFSSFIKNFDIRSDSSKIGNFENQILDEMLHYWEAAKSSLRRLGEWDKGPGIKEEKNFFNFEKTVPTVIKLKRGGLRH